MTTCEFSLVIPGEPRGQGRPRIGRNKHTGRPVAFTDAKTRTYALLAQGEWIAAGRPTLPVGPYGMAVTAYFRRPSGHMLRDGSLSASGRRAPYPGKPDADNIFKGIADALVAVGAIPDDRHLVEIEVRKQWSDIPVSPGVVVDAWSLDVIERAAVIAARDEERA